ncbi:hypothetical protein KIPB_009420, partial [Kipferlia bialata]|eukprot:g9420.t1
MQKAPAAVSFRERTGRPPKDTSGDLLGYLWLGDTISGYWHILSEHDIESDRDKAFGSYVLRRMAVLTVPFGSNYAEVEGYRMHLGDIERMITKICILGMQVLGDAGITGRPVPWAPIASERSAAHGTLSNVYPHAVMCRLCVAVGEGGGIDTWAPEWKRERETAEKQRHTDLVRLALSLSDKCGKVIGCGRRRGRKPDEFRPAPFRADKLHEGIER